ncbi:MAG: DUF1684 domain-containing protein [Woeseiaceae bacterium]|nr:DUF1684 domain-containing protein [Woeseiaceae bacterium]
MNKSLVAICFVALLCSCGQSEPAFDKAAYEAEVLEWREGRLARLKAPTGYLNQIGLFWLEEGDYRFGSGADNDIRLPAKAASSIGVFEVNEAGVRMTAEAGVDVFSDDEPVTSILILDDTTEAPVQVTHRSFAWTVVQRDGRFAVRVRDFEHPFVATFGPLPYFAVDPSLRVAAILRRYDEPRIADVETVIEGLGYHPESPGTVEFVIDDDTYELEAYTSGDRLFFVFGDMTNRDDTYGAGRFLYADAPGEDGRTVLDFNLAYSPPCAFNDFSTCPVASPRNRLPIRIEAGEKFEPSLHYSADAGY